MHSEVNDVERFLPIALNSFVTTSTAPADIYLRISERMVRVIKKDAKFEVERLQNYAGHQITHLYISTLEMALLSKQSIQLLSAVNKVPSFAQEKKFSLLKSAADFVARSLLFGEMSVEDVQLAKEFAAQAFDTISTNSDLTPLIDTIQSMDEALIRHSTAVSMYSMILAFHSGWKTRAAIVTFGLGGLVHDIGFREMDSTLATKDPKALTPQERIAYQAHTEKGLQIARRYRNMSSDVRQIIAQHHELPSGHGFPIGLRGTAIFPAARTVFLADQLAHLTVPIKEGQKAMTVSTAVETILAGQSKDFDDSVIASLEEFL